MPLKHAYCEHCQEEIVCNGVLNNTNRNCGIFSEFINKRDLNPNINPTNRYPFKYKKKYYCVCFKCWQHFKELSDARMFEISCWKGLENLFLNPSSRKTIERIEF